MNPLLAALAGGAVWYFFLRDAPKAALKPGEAMPDVNGDCPPGYAMSSANPETTKVEDLRCIKY
jgi:hypothetical protein